MTREWNDARFEQAFAELIVGGTFLEKPAYYPGYKSRYKHLLMRFAAIAPAEAQDVLDIGGGQLALMCDALWGDRAHEADIGGPHLAYLRAKQVGTTEWNRDNLVALARRAPAGDAADASAGQPPRAT